jgi:hypothetical protein
MHLKFVTALAALMAILPGQTNPAADSLKVTFSKDIAPILWNECAPCHRPGQSTPFPLLEYNDAKKHGRQIAKAVSENYMPPWPPASGFGHFQNERRLSDNQKKLIETWIANGAPEGDPKQLPPPPSWKDGWTLGKPDLIVAMPKPFPLAAEGGDVYRNFAIPIQIDRDRFVRAIEFAPGNASIVHHAFIKLDTSASCRLLDGLDGPPGFSGMNIPAEMPAGQFLTWQPGKLPQPAPENLAWTLPKRSDLVLQLHLNRTGKPETLQSQVGLYFTDYAPTNQAFKFALISLNLHFPPGTSINVVTDSFTFPVPVDLLAVLPHAHYLAREIQGTATLPDEKKEPLILIKDWDFRWQGDYRYVEPLHLPAETKLDSRFIYDNSTNNIHNPNNPPKLVTYGSQSSDEMCELWLQVLPKNSADMPRLKQAADDHLRRVFIDYYRARLDWYPNDPLALTKLGAFLMGEGKFARAAENFQLAIKTNPDYADAHYELGVLYRQTRRGPLAKQELETALRLDPKKSKAWGHLGFLAAEMGKAAESERCFRKALEIDPTDQAARQSLDELVALRRGR